MFHMTIVDMTYLEYRDAIRRGAIGLWGIGVVEEHGPHLPLGTDIYLAHAQTLQIQEQLSAGGIESLILPPFGWGVNDVTRKMPGSIEVRPQTMIDVVSDILVSLGNDGLSQVYCISGHLDSLHLQTTSEAIRQAGARASLDAYFVISAPLLERIGVDPRKGHILPTDETDAVYLHVGASDPSDGGILDLHAGKGETSKMLATHPTLVRREVMATLPATDLTFADLIEWRKGGEAFDRLTPDGYFGSPAAADEDHGKQLMDREVGAVSSAIERMVRSRASSDNGTN